MVQPQTRPTWNTDGWSLAWTAKQFLLCCVVAGRNFTKSWSFVQLCRSLAYYIDDTHCRQVLFVNLLLLENLFLFICILARVMRSSSVISAITHITSSKTSTGTADHHQYTAKKLPLRSNTTHWADVALQDSSSFSSTWHVICKNSRPHKLRA